MKRFNILILCIILPINMATAQANCDLSRFRWDCDIPMATKPVRGASSLVYCGDIRGYLTPKQYDILTHYHGRNINMVLKVNGEYITSPCVPTRRHDYHE